MAGPGAQLVKCLSSMRKARFGPRHHINPVSAHACSPSTWGMRVWKFEAQSQFGYIGSLRPELYETLFGQDIVTCGHLPQGTTSHPVPL